MLPIHNGVKLEIHHRKISEKCPKYLEANNTFLNKPHVKEEYREIRRHFELHENKNISNFVECHKEEIIALYIYTEKEKKFQINHLGIHL